MERWSRERDRDAAATCAATRNAREKRSRAAESAAPSREFTRYRCWTGSSVGSPVARLDAGRDDGLKRQAPLTSPQGQEERAVPATGGGRRPQHWQGANCVEGDGWRRSASMSSRRTWASPTRRWWIGSVHTNTT